MMNGKNTRRAPRKPVAAMVEDYLLIVIGSAVAAVGFNLFMRPAGLASGGVVGISVIAQRLWGMEPAFVQWGLNMPLLVLGIVALGGRFGLKSAVGSFLLPLFILATRTMPGVTEDALLSAVFAGIGIGAGIGFVFRGNGSVGGLSVLARILSERTGVSVGTVMMALDGSVLIAAGALFGPEAAMYALIVVFVMGRTMDLVRVGPGRSKLALVVSEKHEEIGASILSAMDRGLTKLFGQGGFSGTRRPVLLIVMDPTEIVRFKNTVRGIDPSAFVVILDAHEVLGLGFSSRT